MGTKKKAVQLTLDGDEDLDQAPEVLDEFTIDPERIRQEFVRIPAQMARANQVYADALGAYLRAEAKLKEVHARCYLSTREAAEDAGEKLTEAAMKARIETTTSYLFAVSKSIDAEMAKVRAQGQAESVREKCRALQSLGAHVRAELGSMPRPMLDD